MLINATKIEIFLNCNINKILAYKEEREKVLLKFKKYTVIVKIKLKESEEEP